MKTNHWVNAAQAKELLKIQKTTWPLIKKNYEDLKDVHTKTFDMDGFTITVQYNPARIRSSGAKTDQDTIRQRQCFLCPFNLPVQQEKLLFGNEYLFLCNPYPIFPEHFTIPTRIHTDQLIKPHFIDFLELCKRISPLTVFYNGPKAGASAPDHFHFQSVTPDVMPMDREISLLKEKQQLISANEKATLGFFTGYLRNGFIIEAGTPEAVQKLFLEVYSSLKIYPDEKEPGMNLFGFYRGKQWILVIIPRKKHRPWQFDAQGEEHILASPGAADIGGLFITTVKKDYERMDADLLADIYRQVCFSDEEINIFAQRIPKE